MQLDKGRTLFLVFFFLTQSIAKYKSGLSGKGQILFCNKEIKNLSVKNGPVEVSKTPFMGLLSFDILPLASIVTITAKWATISMQRMQKSILPKHPVTTQPQRHQVGVWEQINDYMFLHFQRDTTQLKQQPRRNASASASRQKNTDQVRNLKVVIKSISEPGFNKHMKTMTN